MEELVDIYDKDRNKTGLVKRRDKSEYLPGEYVLASKGVIMNSDGKLLLTKRSSKKKIFPSKWEFNGGATRSGETTLESLQRELKEEIGITIDTSKAKLLKTKTGKFLIKDIFVLKMDIHVQDIHFKDREAQDAKWVTLEQFKVMKSKKMLTPNIDFNTNDYNKCLELLGMKESKNEEKVENE